MNETISSANAAASTLFLGHGGEWWDGLLILSGIAVALAATMAGISTAGSIVAHKREALAAEHEIERFKLETQQKTAEANARAAEAHAKTKESEDRLARFSMPRALFLSGVDCKAAFSGRPDGMKVQIFWLRSVSDGKTLANRIAACLAEKNGFPDIDIIDKVEPIDIPLDKIDTGITVIGGLSTNAWWIEPKTPADFVMKALSAGMKGDPSGVTQRFEPHFPSDLVRVIIGPKV